MVLPNPRTRAAIVVASIALAASIGTATAHAAETDDPRAVPHDGNVTKCAAAGLDGDVIAFWEPGEGKDTENIEFTGGTPESDQYLTITGVADGLDVTGIVLKGGPGYNVYVPGELGLSENVPWEDLRSPLVGKPPRNVPEISHWFVCGTGEPTPPSTTTEPPATTTEPPATTTEPPATTPVDTTSPVDTTEPVDATETIGETETVDDTETTEPGEETEEPEAEDAEEDELALTGFGAGWLIPIGALLLIGGGAAMWLARTRRA